MSRATPKTLGFAKQLIAYETRGKKSSATKTPAACFVCDKLGPHLTNLMGSAGFRALLARSLSLAAAELPWLRAVQVAADNTLEGFDDLGAQVDPNELSAGCTVLLAQLLGLLFAFIGEILTVRLVHDVWPKLSINGLDY